MRFSFPALLVLRQFLVADDPLCGAEIIEKLKIGSGTVYPLLARLTQEGLLVLHATIQPADAPVMLFYRLTEKGRVTFLEMLCRLTIPSDLWRSP